MALPKHLREANKKFEEDRTAHQNRAPASLEADKPRPVETVQPKEPDPIIKDKVPNNTDPTVDPTKSPEYKELDNRFRNLKNSQDQTIYELRQNLTVIEPLQVQLREAQGQIAGLQKQVETMHNQPQGSARDMLSDEQKGDWDEGFTDVVSSVSQFEANKIRNEVRAEYQEQMSALNTRIEQLDGNVQNTRQLSDKDTWDRFLSDLDREIPKWRSWENDSRFDHYMLQIDPVSKRYGDPKKYHELLDIYGQHRDSASAIALYKKFAKDNGLSQDGHDPLEEMIAPDDAGGDAPDLPENKPMYTVAEYQEMGKQLAIKVGQRKISPEDLRQKENELKMIAQEGRIIP